MGAKRKATRLVTLRKASRIPFRSGGVGLADWGRWTARGVGVVAGMIPVNRWPTAAIAVDRALCVPSSRSPVRTFRRSTAPALFSERDRRSQRLKRGSRSVAAKTALDLFRPSIRARGAIRLASMSHSKFPRPGKVPMARSLREVRCTRFRSVMAPILAITTVTIVTLAATAATVASEDPMASIRPGEELVRISCAALKHRGQCNYVGQEVYVHNLVPNASVRVSVETRRPRWSRPEDPEFEPERFVFDLDAGDSEHVGCTRSDDSSHPISQFRIAGCEVLCPHRQRFGQSPSPQPGALEGAQP